MSDENIPEGYTYTPATSAYVNHMGRIYRRRGTDQYGREVASAAMRIENFHVNTWGFAHAAVMAGMADLGTTGPAYVEGGPTVVVIDLSIQFIAAPRLGELLEVHGWCTKRTRSLFFTQCSGEVDGKVVFTASSIQKIVGS